MSTIVRLLTYKYDANSRLTEASDPAATYTFTYDNLGRNTSTEHDLAALGFDVVVDEAYDALGRRTSLAAEIDGTDDLINSYAYDYQNRMTQVTQGSQSGGNTVAEKRADFSYDAEDKGQFTSVTRYADLAGSELVATSTYGYDAADRLTSLTHADSSSSTLAGYTWGYDEGNRLTDFTVAGYSAEDATYSYDDTNQLTGADRSGTTSDESYTYDENGNRTGGSYSTGDNNQITSDGTYNYTYDDEGNRLTKTNISTGDYVEYTWDYRNRLVNITTKTSGGTVTHEVDYTYDIFNRRIVKTIDADGAGAGTATEEIYIYDGLREEQGHAGDHILLAFDESDDLTDRFLYGPNVDQVLASEEVTSTASAGDVLWALTDHLGTVRDVADYNAGTNTTTVQNHLTYDAFGNITAETNAAVDFLFGFTGRERDEESDLQYNRARYYDAAIGKWISEDPIGFDGIDDNLYRYVNGNPIQSVDPTGQTGYSEVIRYASTNDIVARYRRWGGFTAFTGRLEDADVNGTWKPKPVIPEPDLNLQEHVILEDSSKECAIILRAATLIVRVGTLLPSNNVYWPVPGDKSQVPIVWTNKGVVDIRNHEAKRREIYRLATEKYVDPVSHKGSLIESVGPIWRRTPGQAKKELLSWLYGVQHQARVQFQTNTEIAQGVIGQEVNTPDIYPRPDGKYDIHNGYKKYVDVPLLPPAVFEPAPK